jgi:hypothetical protein
MYRCEELLETEPDAIAGVPATVRLTPPRSTAFALGSVSGRPGCAVV